MAARGLPICQAWSSHLHELWSQISGLIWTQLPGPRLVFDFLKLTFPRYENSDDNTIPLAENRRSC